MIRRTRLSAAGVLLVLSGCAGLDDPYQRAGTWNPTNSNDANLLVTVDNPRHLIRGASDQGSPAVLSAAAVHRLLSDHLKPLPEDASVSGVQGGASQSAGTSGSTP